MKRSGRKLLSQAKLYPRLVRRVIDHCCIRAKTMGFVRGYDVHDIVVRYFHGKRYADSYDTESILNGLVDIGLLSLSHHCPTPDQIAFAGLGFSTAGYKRTIEGPFDGMAGVKTHFAYTVDLEHPLLERLARKRRG